MKNEKVAKIMTKDVITTHVAERVSDVRKLFATNGFHHVPVVSGKKLIGILSASDILGISVEGIGTDERTMDAYLDHQFSIEGLMTPDVRTLGANATVSDAAEILSEGSIHAVPVVGAGETLEGLVTSTDLIRYLRDRL